MEQAKLILFAHIPKTAGMTLWTIIKQNYQKQNCHYYHVKQPLEKTAQIINNSPEIAFAMGHFGFGFHQLLNQPYVYLTILREPIQRTISDYYYYQQSEMVINEYNPPLTWEEFCPRMANNLMTRFYAGLEFQYMKEYGSFAHLRTAKIENSPNLKDYYSYPETKLLELAKKNLKDNFDFVGLVERFDESLLLLKQHLKWKQINYIRRNAGNKKPETINLAPAIKDCITNYNQLDIELYKYAQKLFNEQVSRQRDSLDRELMVFKRSNQRYSQLANSTQLQEKILNNLPSAF